MCCLQVAAQLGVPEDAQRYWVWQQRQNKTYRPTSRLKPDEESAHIVDLREHREMGVRRRVRGFRGLGFGFRCRCRFRYGGEAQTS